MINSISLTGDWELDIQQMLEQYNKPHTYEHSVKVANEAKRIATDIFKVENETILDAISCHTTLRENATPLDMVLFVADKIKWDQSGTPPYITEIQEALDQSLEHACFVYISYLWERRQDLKVVHPWLQDAYFDLKEKLGVE